MKTKIVIELTVECPDSDEIANLVNDQLDAGVIQYLIAEWASDHLGARGRRLKFLDSRCRTEEEESTSSGPIPDPPEPKASEPWDEDVGILTPRGER